MEDIFQDCQDKFENDKPAFLSLLEQHIDLDEMIPASFRNHFYASSGRTRKYPLQAFLWALIIQRIFSIPTDQLLLTFLAYSKPLREFCGFSKVPDALTAHTEITVDKKSDSPDEDKSVHDARLLIPTLKDFFVKHPLINPILPCFGSRLRTSIASFAITYLYYNLPTRTLRAPD